MATNGYFNGENGFDYESQGCLHEIFDRQAQKTPEAVVVVAPPSNEEERKNPNSSIRTLKLNELDGYVSLLAKYLQEKCDVVPDTSVGIYMEKCPEYVISYAAILKAGGGYMPLDVSYPKPLLHSILEEACPKAICTKPEYVHIFENENIPLIVMDSNWNDRLQKEFDTVSKSSKAKKEAPKVSLDDLAYLVYSSGTTGKPKGIRCPHRGAVFSYHWRHVAYPFKPDDRVACNVFFVWEMFRPILKGIPMYIIPDDVIYDPSLLCQFIKRHRITRILFTPSLFEAILSTQSPEVIKECFGTMRIIWLCGEVVTVTLLRRADQLLPHVRILNLYSISECHDVTALDLTEWYRDHEAALADPMTTRKFAPVGTLLPGVKVAVIDDDFQAQPVGMSGEIFVGGPTLALGYLNRPEINEKRFLQTPSSLASKLGPRLYRTGDWGYVLADGSLEICGRCDSMQKIRGYSVEIQAIEAALLQINGVSACVVVVKGEEGEDKYLVAYVVPDTQQSITRKAIRSALKARLPFYMIPSYFVIVQQLPLLAASSKVDKKALPEVDRIRDTIEPEALPNTPTEVALAKLWADVLGLTAVDVNESFFDLGGHSLLATKLLNQVKLAFDIDLSVRELFAEPTVAGLARILDSRKSNPNAVLCAGPTVDLAEEVEKLDLKHTVTDIDLRAFWRSLRWSDRWTRGCVLLTGATGFLGSFLLRDILQKTKLRVVCIVRESPGTSLESRLKSALEQIGMTKESLQEFQKRVLVFKGDVGLTSMGLNEDDYQYLSCDVDFVIHAAAYVNLVYPYSALRGGNVLGTQNVLTFCYASKIKPLHYISTDGIFPHGLKDCGEDIDISQFWPKLTDGYSQSKWVSEQLVLKAQRRGLPAVIYRLGNQAGESKTGVWNPQDFTYLMLYGCAAVGAVPEIDWQMEMTPVDFTTDIILEVATTHFTKSVGKILHLINVEAPHCSDVFNWMEEKTKNFVGYEFEHVAFDEWLARIRNRLDTTQDGSGQLKLLERLLECTVKDSTYFSSLATFNRANTDVFLAEIGKIYPSIDARYIQNAIRQLRERGQLPHPKGVSVKPLSNKVCVVTGASSGIGDAIAKILAIDGGAKVALLARRMEKLEEVRRFIEESGGQAITVQCDVANRKQAQEAFSHTMASFGAPVDVVVNSAGVMHYTLMKNLHIDEWQQEIDVNVTGTVNVLAACLKSMVDRKTGHIVNITSDAGRRPFPGLAVYTGTKYFIEGMSGALRQELVEHGIRVTNIQPGDVATELFDHTTDTEAASKFINIEKDEQKKILDPIDVANAVYYAVTSPPHCAINEILIEPRHAPI